MQILNDVLYLDVLYELKKYEIMISNKLEFEITKEHREYLEKEIQKLKYVIDRFEKVKLGII